MAFEILEAIKNEQHIAVEAGVGIGKSFAYLVPLMLYNQLSKKPVVIATSTIALQEQLLDDAHRLQKLLHLSQEITLAKGQTHFLQEFKDDTNSVLLGTEAYWEGISIEGKSLSNLIIFRLPIS